MTDLRIKNNNSLDLAARKGETLTLTLESGDAVVTFNALGARGELTAAAPRDIVVPATGTGISLLVRATFKSASGGAVVVHVSDATGAVAPFTISQLSGSATNAVIFLIDIE